MAATGRNPLQAGLSTSCRSPRTRFFAAAPIPQGRDSCAPAVVAIQKRKKISTDLFPRKRKTSVFPFSRTALTRRSFRVALPTVRACRQRPICDRSTTSSCGLPTNKKCGPAALRREPACHVCQTCSKKRRLLAQENTRRHAWLSRSCFGRKNLFIDGPHLLLPFFLSPFLQRKRKKKTEANSAGSNTSLGLTSFVLTMYAIGPSRLVR